MKREALFNYYICNGRVTSTEDMSVFDSISLNSVYEVIKIIDGIPLFFQEHLTRMKTSLHALGTTLEKSGEEILREIVKLVELNQCKYVNVKLVYDTFGDKQSTFLVYFIKSEYPEEDAYDKGIHAVLFSGKRQMPNIKTVSGSFRQRVQKVREKEGAYEALLVNEEGYIAEGSRSNVFFTKEDGLYTPPGKDVLLGVTRNHVIKICKQLGIPIKEELVHREELNHLMGAFITGTTVDILPIGSIEGIHLLSTRDKKIEEIIKAYHREMEKDIQKIRAILRGKDF